jgi:phosphoribosylformylglycinamidine synthase
MMASPVPGGGPPAWLGAALRVPFPARKDFVLFGEDASRIVVSLPAARWGDLEALAAAANVPLVRLGAVGGERLEIQGALSVAVADLAAAWRDGLPRVLRHEAEPDVPRGV